MPFDGSEIPDAFGGNRGPRLPKAASAKATPWIVIRRAFEGLLRGAIPARLFGAGDPVVPREVLVVQVLCAARALIELEDKWTRGYYQTIWGRRCAVGALRAAGRTVRDPRAFALARNLLRTEATSRGFTHIEMMNDRSTHAQVVAAFDAAIAKAKAHSEQIGSCQIRVSERRPPSR
jgi:hypothetical protein